MRYLDCKMVHNIANSWVRAAPQVVNWAVSTDPARPEACANRRENLFAFEWPLSAT